MYIFFSYCTKVLNNDVELFSQAYELIGREKDENKLEVTIYLEQ